MNWGPEDLGFNLELNQSETLGIKDDHDKAVRELFREDKFRQASAMPWTVMASPSRSCAVPSCARSPAASIPVHPNLTALRSSTILTMSIRPRHCWPNSGLKDTDGNGILNFTAEGPWPGQDVVLGLNTSQDAHETQRIGDQFVAMLGAVGIKVNARPMTSQADTDINTSGEWDMRYRPPG